MNTSAINLRALDVLRGILATYVLLGHARWLLWCGHATYTAGAHPQWEKVIAASTSVFRFGNEAVMIFFVLSGFFIHIRAARQLATSNDSSFSATSFYRRRLHRLLAPYLLALLLTVLLDVVGRIWFPTLYLGQTGDSLLDANFVQKDFSWQSVAPALLMLPTSLGHDFGSNGPLWSLACEVVYYALYPVWHKTRMRGALLAYGCVGGFFLALSLFPLPSALGFVGKSLGFYPIWIAGAALAEITEWSLPNPVKKINKPFLATVSFVVGLGGCILIPFALARVICAMIFGVATVVLALSISPAKSNHIVLRSLEFLGIRSYTIYITHFPLLVFISAWLIQCHGGRPVSGWIALGGSLMVLVVCLFLFKICEKRFLHERLHL